MINKIINDRYKIVEKLAEGGMSIVYLAYDLTSDSNNKIALKFLKKIIISKQIEDIIRFKNEALILSKVNNKNIIKVIEIGEFDSEYYIAMEYAAGKSLADIIDKTNSPAFSSIDKTINIMLQICDGLKAIHLQGVLHKDVTPGNILLTENDSLVKIIDFGVAEIFNYSRVNKEEYIAGTISYMSPERLGGIKRSIDVRSDLYSLGVVFYELLTGQKPFLANDLHILIHQHIAKNPHAPRSINKKIPVLLDKIVLKLLEKDPDNRYQTVYGLLKDLEEVKKGNYDIVLGKNDYVQKLRNYTTLIGREKEWNRIKQAYFDMRKGKGLLLLLGGKTGSGKTRLTEELRGFCVSNRCSFLVGKCFSGENKTPYGPFIDILSNYIKMYDTYSNEKNKKITSFLEKIPNEYINAIIELNPSMSTVTGGGRKTTKLDPVRENERYIMMLSNFICNLAKAEGCLVFVLDDMQWADEGSLLLLNEILKNISNVPLMVVGTYRSDEVDEKHGIKKIIRTAVQRFYPLVNMNVRYFNKKQMAAFVDSLLRFNENNLQEIADFLIKKSQGNPFFCKEILKQLMKDQVIVSGKDNEWVINKENLNDIKVPDTIVNILMKRISSLNIFERIVLAYASVIGKEFEIGFILKLCHNLSEYTDIQIEEVVSAIDRAIEQQLIEIDVIDSNKVMFSHDKIKDIFYNDIEADTRKKIHLQIAKTIEDVNQDELEKNLYDSNCLFDLTYHCIMAGDKDRILTYAYTAGLKAKNNYANIEAIKYLDIVIILLEGMLLTGNNEYRELWKKCSQCIGDIYIRIGGNDAAIGLYKQVMDYVDDPVEKAEIYKQISQAYFKKGDWVNCEKYGKIGLGLLGEKLPTTNLRIIISIVKELILRAVYSIFPRYFHRALKNEEEKKHKLKLWYYYSLEWAYIFSDIKKFFRSTLRMVNLAESLPEPCRESAMSMRAYATLLSFMKVPFENKIKFHDKPLEISEQLNDEWGVAQSLQLMGYSAQFNGMYNESIDYFKKGIRIFEKIGDMREVGFSMLGLCHCYYVLSDFHESEKVVQEYYEISRKIEDNMGICAAQCHLTKHQMLRGDFDKALEFGFDCLERSNTHAILFINCITSIDMAIVFHKLKNFSKSDMYFDKARKLIESNTFLGQYIVYFYSEYANALIDRFIESEHDYSNEQKNKILSHIKKSCDEAVKKTKPWIIKYFTALRVKARYYALIQKRKKANKLFLKSIAQSIRVGDKFETAKGYYDYGTFMYSINEKKKALDYWQKAYVIFVDSHADYYAKVTASLLGIKNDEKLSPFEAFIQKNKDNSKYDSALALINEISLNQSIENVLNKVISISVELTGAESGYIFVKTNSDELKVIASLDINATDLEHVSRSVIHKTFEKGKYILTTNASLESDFSSLQTVLHYDLKSILSLPVQFQGVVKAVCYLSNTLLEGIFSEEDVEILQVLMTQVAGLLNDETLNTLTSYVSEKSVIFDEYGITNREIEVLQLLHKGYSNKEISNKLNVAENTLKNHLRNIYKKTNLKNKIQLLNLFKDHLD